LQLVYTQRPRAVAENASLFPGRKKEEQRAVAEIYTNGELVAAGKSKTKPAEPKGPATVERSQWGGESEQTGCIRGPMRGPIEISRSIKNIFLTADARRC